MKTKLCFFLTAALVLSIFTSCEKKEEVKDYKVTLGAQSNTTIDGFYAVPEDETYTLSEAFQNQSVMDIFCFYEVGNDITLASPGSSITGIITGEAAFENWTTKNLTLFYQTALTAAQFDAIQEGDALIYNSYPTDPTLARKKAKLLTTDQVWAFKTTDNYYGLIKVISTVQGATDQLSLKLKQCS